MRVSAQPFEAIDEFEALPLVDATPPHEPESPAAKTHRQHRLADGRTISYAEYGDLNGLPVLGLHGTPGSRLKFASTAEVAHRLGLRLICLDRWGYGGTDIHRRPSLVAFAADVLALFDALNIRKFALVGISGGGPYAAAVAAHGGDRVIRFALVSPIGPLYALPSRKLRPFHRICFSLLPRVPGALTVVFRFYRFLLLLAPQATVVLASIGASAPDRRLIRSPAVRQRLAETFRTGLARSADGAVCDLKLFSRPWEFPLGAINCRTRIWHGALDHTVPAEAVENLLAGLQNGQLSVLHDEGHFWISLRYTEIYEWLGGA
jgi:pimeloyl-ACP methyl ester carboxylesterase